MATIYPASWLSVKRWHTNNRWQRGNDLLVKIAQLCTLQSCDRDGVVGLKMAQARQITNTHFTVHPKYASELRLSVNKSCAVKMHVQNDCCCDPHMMEPCRLLQSAMHSSPSLLLGSTCLRFDKADGQETHVFLYWLVCTVHSIFSVLFCTPISSTWY